ncbi:hypothetical protein SSARUM2_001114 [Serratia sp. K-E0102]|uniref:hypothetical protein n=1 Tax=Serratia sp. K-E0102 TaxID=3021405 RepID=UPI00249EDA86|nr:hypothetical protein [Serratia sp. K-E0102]WGZ68773.1 hypothetical protein SSARUM2_001114 [Serratia sp. K-E0102]
MSIKRNIYIRGMYGLGDSIYQRAFVRQFPGAYIRTPWPELYADLDVKFVKSNTLLRTQRKNEDRTWLRYVPEPTKAEVFSVFYGADELARGSIVDAMTLQFCKVASQFDLPSYGPSPVISDKPIAVIRPATVRREWANPARNPDPKYINEASALLKKHFYVVSLADLEEGEEWLVGDAPAADLQLHAGELSVTQILALVEHAAVVVSGLGWALPAAICYKTPVFIIQGGCGGHNAPHIVTDPEMDLSRVGWAQPDNYCMCGQMDHACSKHITGFGQQFKDWLNEIVLSTS